MEVPGTNLAGVLQKLIGWDPKDNLRLRVYILQDEDISSEGSLLGSWLHLVSVSIS